MKNFKFQYILAFVSLGFIFTSCDKDDDDNNDSDNQITITIEDPVDGGSIAYADCANIHVHIDFSASVENHEVEVVLHPEGDVSDKIIDYDEHAHDKEITFDQDVDLCSYPAGTCFHLEVAACLDHDCVEKARAEAEFCIE